MKSLQLVKSHLHKLLEDEDIIKVNHERSVAYYDYEHIYVRILGIFSMWGSLVEPNVW